MKLNGFKVKHEFNKLNKKNTRENRIIIWTIIVCVVVLIGSIIFFSYSKFSATTTVKVITAKVGQFVHRITYDPNGGSVNPSYRDVREKNAYGELPIPVRNGYVHNGWWTDRNNGEEVSALDVMGTEDVTIYAHWIKARFDLIVKPNGGEWEGHTANQTYNLEYEEEKNISDPTKEGHTFTGWTVSGNGSSISNGTFKMGHENASIEARYDINQYKLTIDLDDGSDEEEYNLDYQETKRIEDPEREGYTFTGWDNTDYISDGTYTQPATDVKIKATWVANDYKWIVYHNKMDVNGETYTLSETDEGEGPYDTEFSGTLKNYNGFTKPSEQSKRIKVEEDYPPTKNVINYNYSRNKYKLTVKPNGGSYNNSANNSEFNMYFEETKEISDPTRTCYTFDSWTKDGNATLQNRILKMGTEETSLEANWNIIKYSVIFDPNGGIFNDINDATHIVDCGDSVALLPTNSLSRDGYTFDGWYTKQTGGTKIESAITPEESTTVYAHWTPITYTLSYDLDGGTVSPANPTTYNIESENITLRNPEKDEYTFIGWSGTDLTGNENKTVIIENGSIGNRSYVAHYKYKTYNIELDKQNGEDGTDVIYERYNHGYYLDADASTEMTTTQNPIETPTRTGYTFKGYYTQSNGSGTKYINEDGKLTSDVSNKQFSTNGKLYAYWSPNIYVLELDKQYGTGGTDTIYEKYDNGYYLNSNATNQMTTSANPITVPTRSGYEFDGYFTETNGNGTKYIDSNGKLTSSAENNKFSYNSVLYAGWHTKELTCAAGKYIPANSDTCTDCPAGSYCAGGTWTYDGSEKGRSACSSLADGSYTTSAAKSTAASACYIPKANLSGKYVATANQGPVTCSKGGYCPGATDIYYGQTGGKTGCGDGKYNDATGSTAATACKNIKAGCYGSSAESACPAECQGRTKYSAEGAKECSTVSNGYQTTGCNTSNNKCTGQSACTAGNFCVNGVSTACVQGSYSAATASACTACGPTANGGKTTSGTGKTSCDANCSNTTGVSAWATASWSNNQVSNLCKISTCSTGYNLDTTNNKCTAKSITCAAGQYLPANSATCTDCPAGSYCAGGTWTYDGSEKGRSACSSLSGGAYTSSATKSTSAAACYIPKANLSGKYVATANQAPVTCSKGGYCPGTTDVFYGQTGGKTGCGDGKYSDTTGSSAVSACKNITAGCYGSSAESACPAECQGRTKYSAEGAKECSTVSNGYQTTGCNTSNNKCTGQSACTAGNFCVNGVSTACAQGSYSAATASACTACGPTANSGKTTSGTGKTSCDANCSNATGVSAWTTASWSNNSVSNLCKVSSCGTGYNLDTTNNKCTAKSITCAAGQYLPANSATCTDCPAGSYCAGGTWTYDGSEKGKAACSSLGGGAYTTSAAKSTAASACYIPKANLSGKYVATANQAPVTCSKGGYCPGTTDIYYGQTGGKTGCGDGKYNDATGSSASTACKSISAGCYGSSAESACPAECQGRTKYSTGGAKECSTVSSGYQTTGCTSNNKCTGQSACTAGNFCLNGVSTACAQGSYSGAQATSCTACGPTANSGKTTSGTGKTSCDANCSNATGVSGWTTASWSNNSVSNLCKVSSCGTGYNLDTTNNKCTAKSITCAAGQYLPANSATCTDCPAGSYCAGGTWTYDGSEKGRSACSSLGSGYTSDAKAKVNTECYLNVDNGKYKTTATGTATGNCAAGTFKTAHKSYYNSSDSCTNCVQGSYSAAAASSCTACQGKTTSGAGKTSCDANCSNATGVSGWTTASWSNNSVSNLCKVSTCGTGYNLDTTNNKCTAKSITCSAGQYLPANSATCTDCPAGSYCAGGTWTYDGSEKGRSACSSLGGGAYTTSVAKSTAASACYIPKANLSGKYVATANQAPVTCSKGGYCPGTTDIYYGQTGGRTGCGDGKYNDATGSSASTACKSISAGCYGSSAESACPAECQGRTKYSTGGAKECSTVSNGYQTTGCNTSNNKCTGQTACTAGNFCLNGVSTACAQGSYSGAQATSCTACGPTANGGKTTSGTGKTSCDANCSNATGVSAWTTASWSNNSVSNLCKVSSCGTGYNLDTTNNKCTAKSITCSAGQYLPANSATCTDCPAGSYCAGGTWTYDGFEKGRTACSSLGSGYTSDAKAKVNTECYLNVDNGKYKTTATGTATGNCAAGTFKTAHKSYYNSSDSCTNCATGSYSAAAASSCTACQGKTTSGAGKTSCDANCSNATGVSAWTTASWSNNSVSNLCKVSSCGTGYNLDTTNNKCTAKSITCSAGQYLPANSATCTDCPAGSYCAGGTWTYDGSEKGRSACSSLGGGAYTTSAAKSTAASACYIPKANLSGKYVATANQAPVTCSKGGYCPGTTDIYYGQIGGRTGCGDGKYNDATGSSASTACKSISAGCYGSSAASACPAECQGRTKYSTGGAKECSTVSSGYQTTGCTSNNKCTGQSACTAGNFCLNGVSTACAQGSYSGAQATSCTACGPTANSGKTTSGTGKTSCDANCSNRTGVSGWATASWSNNSVSNLCKVSSCGTGYNLDSTNNKCTAKSITCSAGQYLPVNSATCTACPAGSYCTGGTWTYDGSEKGRTACSSLGTGYTSAASATANTSCYLAVGAGKYKTTATGTATSNCAAGTFKAAHNSYYNSSDSCTNCATGSYSAAASGTCTACQGKTTSGTGQTSCNANCSNATGVSTWATATWTSNTVSNLCKISTCNESIGYILDGTSCRKITAADVSYSTSYNSSISNVEQALNDLYNKYK